LAIAIIGIFHVKLKTAFYSTKASKNPAIPGAIGMATVAEMTASAPTAKIFLSVNRFSHAKGCLSLEGTNLLSVLKNGSKEMRENVGLGHGTPGDGLQRRGFRGSVRGNREDPQSGQKWDC
jgi:hypothetical protein